MYSVASWTECIITLNINLNIAVVITLLWFWLFDFTYNRKQKRGENKKFHRINVVCMVWKGSVNRAAVKHKWDVFAGDRKRMNEFKLLWQSTVNLIVWMCVYMESQKASADNGGGRDNNNKNNNNENHSNSRINRQCFSHLRRSQIQSSAIALFPIVVRFFFRARLISWETS